MRGALAILMKDVRIEWRTRESVASVFVLGVLLLRVDLGTEERQLVAGICAHYDPAALVGSQVVVVANLEPAKLRGVESQGMVLAASDGDRIVLLRPDDPVTPGAVVR